MASVSSVLLWETGKYIHTTVYYSGIRKVVEKTIIFDIQTRK